jgi:hypothetical protein
MNERRNDLEIVKGRATVDARSNSDRSPLYDVRNHANRCSGESKRFAERCFRGRMIWADRQSTIWWSQTGSNRRPHACKARALPAELWPRNQKTNASRRSLSCISFKRKRTRSMVGLGRLELPTSRLSSARSNQLSYKPLTRGACMRTAGAERRMLSHSAAPGACSSAKKEKRRRRNPACGTQRS